MMEELLSQGASPSSDGNFSAGRDNDLTSATIVSLDERILDITSRHSLSVLRTPPTKKAKRVRFFRNGDKYYTGVVMAVTPERYRSFDSLASDLTRALVSSVTLPNGVRTIYTMDGRKVQSISDLEDGKCYVVSGQGEIFKKVEYSASKVRRGSSLSGLPQSPAAGSGGGSGSGGGGTGRQTSAIPLCVKARIVTLIRHGTKPRKVLRLLLNKRNAPSLEHAMEAITDAVKLDTGAVRKVYTLSGQQITSLEQFFENDDIFVAYGPEKSVQEDFELDFEESKCVQSFRRCPWTSKRQSGPMPRMPRKSGKKTSLTTPQIRTPSPSSLMLPQPLRMHYTVGPVIGDGNFAVVRQCIQKFTGDAYAMKIVDKHKCQGKETMLASEVAILRQVCHPNIISLIAEQETADQLFLVMELVKGGDLFDAIAAATKFSEAEASVMISHLTSALAYLHSHHIVHRDVKPENLLVEMDGSHVRCLKLGDFGLAQVVREPLYTVCGTPTYVAPEILAETGYGLKIDVWAAGVILYILLCGFPPFVSLENEQEELFERILSGQYEFTSPYWDNISDSAKQLITNMLQAQPELRFSAEDVLDHPWLAQSFLGGEQTAATGAPAEQHWDQQCKPVKLATFEFDFKRQRGQQRQVNADNNQAKTRSSEWRSDHDDALESLGIVQRGIQPDKDEIDFANGNHGDANNDSAFFGDYVKDIDSLSRSMRDLIDKLNDNRAPRRRLMSRSAASSCSSIPEDLNATCCRDGDNSPLRRDEKAATTPRSSHQRGDQKNGNLSRKLDYHDSNSVETTFKVPSEVPRRARSKCTRRNVKNDGGGFNSDDFRNSNVSTVSTSSDSLAGDDSSAGNDIETSDSFVNIQFARLASGQRSSSTQSMESTSDSFENVNFCHLNRNSCFGADRGVGCEKNSEAAKLATVDQKDQKKSARIHLHETNQIVALNARSSKLDNHQSERRNCNSKETTNKCARNEPVKFRHINKKTQADSRSTKSKRNSCFPAYATKRTPEEGVVVGHDKITTRKFNSTDELRDEVRRTPPTRLKRLSLYYTPQPLRKTYEGEAKTTGRIIAPKSVSRAQKPDAMTRVKDHGDEKTDKSRRSVMDASTIASRSRASNRQSVHVKPNQAVVNRTK